MQTRSEWRVLARSSQDNVALMQAVYGVGAWSGGRACIGVSSKVGSGMDAAGEVIIRTE